MKLTMKAKRAIEDLLTRREESGNNVVGRAIGVHPNAIATFCAVLRSLGVDVKTLPRGTRGIAKPSAAELTEFRTWKASRKTPSNSAHP